MTTTGSTAEPPRDNGDLGPGPSGEGDHGGDDPGNNGDDARIAVVIVGGPTLSDDYPEYWGNVYPTDLAQCAVFTNESDHPITIQSVTVPSPLVVVTDCAPHADGRRGPGCTPNLALPVGGECVAGIQVPPGTDLSKNYTGNNSWELSAVCTDATSAPCRSNDVAARHPSVLNPVEVRWTVALPVRFCGGTDYADASGNPGGTGTHPRNGCSAAKPQSLRTTASISSVSHGQII